MKKIVKLSAIGGLICASLLSSNILVANAINESDLQSKSSILIDGDSGKVLYENNADEKRPIASIVKLMTLAIAFEEIDNGNIAVDDIVTVSERASSMGGSQIFLDTGSEHRLDMLIKGIIISSANDASVAVAEHIAGSESRFVEMMNEKAAALGMADTHYTNTNGLPSPEMHSTARDVALLMREVGQYPLYKQFSQIKLDEYVHPDGRVTQMSNTNKLLKTYDADISGKTGSTLEAGYCLAVSAVRGDEHIVAVVLKAENSTERFAQASDLLTYGFENFENCIVVNESMLDEYALTQKFTQKPIDIYIDREYREMLPVGSESHLTTKLILPEKLEAVSSGEQIGEIQIYDNENMIDSIAIISNTSLSKPSVIEITKHLLKQI